MGFAEKTSTWTEGKVRNWGKSWNLELD